MAAIRWFWTVFRVQNPQFVFQNYDRLVSLRYFGYTGCHLDHVAADIATDKGVYRAACVAQVRIPGLFALRLGISNARALKSALRPGPLRVVVVAEVVGGFNNGDNVS